MRIIRSSTIRVGLWFSRKMALARKNLIKSTRRLASGQMSQSCWRRMKCIVTPQEGHSCNQWTWLYNSSGRNCRLRTYTRNAERSSFKWSGTSCWWWTLWRITFRSVRLIIRLGLNFVTWIIVLYDWRQLNGGTTLSEGAALVLNGQVEPPGGDFPRPILDKHHNWQTS